MKNFLMKMVSISITIIFLAILIRTVNAFDGLQDQVYSEDFEDGQAQGWELEPGWQIINDNGNKVLSGQGHVWARSNQNCSDCTLSFRLKVIKGRIHLVYRMNDSGRYFIGFDSRGSMLNKQYWPDTFQNGIKGKTIKHSSNVWHQIEIKGDGAKITFTVDGKAEWTYVDSRSLSEGSFAFETQDNSQAYLDDIVVNVGANPPEATPQNNVAPTTKPEAALTWVRTGGPLGGLGYDVRMSPDNLDKMFVTDSFAGIFMSQDSGKNWLPSNSGIDVRDGSTGDFIPVFSVTIDPTHPKNIWIGTQNRLGIYKSTDGGETWKRMVNGISEGSGISFRGFTVDPTNSDVVYAAAEISSWADGKPARSGLEFDMTRGVVYKSTNGGKNWKSVWRGENLARYIWIDPHETNVIYVSTGIFDREANNSDPARHIAGGEGILKSTDGGITWKQVNNGLGNLYVGSLFMNPTNPDILLAGTGNNVYSTNGGIYITTNGGDSWRQVLNEISAITSVEFSSSNPSIAYAGSELFIYRSDDGGFSWRRVSGSANGGWGAPGTRGGFPIDFQVDPRNPERIFANAYGGGNFLSEDGGKTWVDASRGYTGSMVRSIAVDPIQSGRVLTGARSGLFLSLNGGGDWAGICHSPVYFMGWQAVAMDPADPRHFLAGSTDETTMAQSRDGGLSWDIVIKLPESEHISWSSFAFAPSNSSVIYAGTAGYVSAGAFDYSIPGKGIYKSQDGGKSWKQANDSLTQNAHVVMLAVDPSNPQSVFVATSNHGLLKTTDGGVSWQVIRNGLPDTNAISVAVHPKNSNIIAVSFDRQALYISRDGGKTWIRSSSGMPAEASLKSILFDPVHPDEIMYGGDFSSGVYRSIDGGKKWELVNNGLLDRAINRLAISEDGLHLYAATEGGGVFRLDLNNQPPS